MAILDSLNKRTEPYYERVLDLVKPHVPGWAWGNIHLNARAHAGGKASPKKPPEVTFSNRAELMAALQDGVLGQASDDDLTRMHDMVHRVFVQKGGPGSGHHGHRGRPGSRGGSAPGRSGIGLVAWEELDSEMENIASLKTGLNSIPDSHIEGLTSIDFEQDFEGIESAGTSDTGVVGLYYPDDRRIGLLEGGFADQNLVTHEIGHHYGFELAPISLMAEQERAYDSVRRMDTSELRTMGLGTYAQTNSDEFFAESYSVFAAALRGGQSARRARPFVDMYRSKFPEFTRLMEEAFAE